MSLALAIATPFLAFAGALVGQMLNLRSAKQLETRSRREETMRNLRWAAEMAVDLDVRRGQLGVRQLEALGVSEMLDIEQAVFVDAALAVAAHEESVDVEIAPAGTEEGEPGGVAS